MNAQQALADLTEISSQVEVAAILDGAGAVVASTLSDPAAAERLGALAARLLEAASAAGAAGAELAQLEVAQEEGSVFLVRDAERAIVAVTRSQPTVGLVFYDLKSALRSAAIVEASAS
jgi:predicted regulator of Ras-like GTPase activity (Roadblock/LC7/MglB family)